MNTYLASWDSEGFEFLQDVSKYEYWDQEQLVGILANKPIGPNPLNALVGHLRLRAQFNPQRHYEIYSFTVDSNLSEEDVRALSKNNPQFLVDWIRANGYKLYSDRNTKKPVII